MKKRAATHRTFRKARKLKFLDDWEWTTLVAAWRYFEHRMTIASASFPEDVESGRFQFPDADSRFYILGLVLQYFVAAGWREVSDTARQFEFMS